MRPIICLTLRIFTYHLVSFFDIGESCNALYPVVKVRIGRPRKVLRAVFLSQFKYEVGNRIRIIRSTLPHGTAIRVDEE